MWLIIGIFEEQEQYFNLSICPRHRDAFGLGWRSNRKLCCFPSSWAFHRKANVKGERGITLTQSHRLYMACKIVIPVGSSKLVESGNSAGHTPPFSPFEPEASNFLGFRPFIHLEYLLGWVIYLVRYLKNSLFIIKMLIIRPTGKKPLRM